MNSKKGLIILCIILLGIITGCGVSNEEKEKRERYFAQAKENAANYIKKKYGFTPEITSSECTFDNSDMFSSYCNEEIVVSFEYNNESYDVLISGSEETVIGYDNYQVEEITQDIVNKIEKQIDLKPYKYSISYSDSTCYVGVDDICDGKLSEYYKKENLDKLLDEHYFYILLEFIDNESFETNINLDSLYEFVDVNRLTLINYDSNDSYNSASTHSERLYEEDLIENALNIENSFMMEYGNLKYYDFELEEYDDIYFYDSENNSISLSKTSIDDLDLWIGHGTSNPKKVSDAYAINTNADSIYVYIPVSNLKKYKASELNIAIQCDSNDETKYYTSGPLTYSKIGNYYVKSLSLVTCDSDIRFTVVKD